MVNNIEQYSLWTEVHLMVNALWNSMSMSAQNILIEYQAEIAEYRELMFSTESLGGQYYDKAIAILAPIYFTLLERDAQWEANNVLEWEDYYDDVMASEAASEAAACEEDERLARRIRNMGNRVSVLVTLPWWVIAPQIIGDEYPNAWVVIDHKDSPEPFEQALPLWLAEHEGEALRELHRWSNHLRHGEYNYERYDDIPF